MYGLPSRQRRQRPQLTLKVKQTWSPALTSCTPAPTSTISPAPSWPSTIGVGRGRSPLISDRSEWQRPAPPTLTSTSPSPGGSSSTSSTWMGFDLANGRGAPHTVSTPAFIFIDMILSQQTPAVQPRFAASGNSSVDTDQRGRGEARRARGKIERGGDDLLGPAAALQRRRRVE